MKKTKKTLVIATAFVVAMNVSACVYGPPMDDTSDTPSTTEVVQEETVDTSEDDSI